MTENDVIRFCRDLLRIDTSNFGDGTGPGERTAAEYVADRLAEAGLPVDIIEPAHGRANVIARWAGRDDRLAPLLVHGHIDVAPSVPEDWTHHPLSGEVADGCLWGRGAMDMKSFIATVLAVVQARRSSGRPPARDIVLAFAADEEGGGQAGARWLVERRPALFEGCLEAVSGMGGHSVTLRNGRRLYLIGTGQKGMVRLRVTFNGGGAAAGQAAPDVRPQVEELAAAVARHQFPVRLTPSVRQLLEMLAAETGDSFDPADPAPLLANLGTVERVVAASLRHTVELAEPHTGEAVEIEGRYLPGLAREFLQKVDELIGPDADVEIARRKAALETVFSGSLVEAMEASLLAEDPQACAAPYLHPTGTAAAASFSRLGMRSYRFLPLRLPAGFDPVGMSHGVDERVPVDGLRFGVRVLDRFFDLC
jgi:acetylornithine deacetylase/succinyl-diaminopimelate desuccinylase-like protein